MPSPFPGMNPYLQHPAFWFSFHARLIVAIADTLAPDLRPKYYIEVQTRTYREQGATLTQKRPQSITLPLPTTIKERYLEVRELGSDLVIAVIEVLSPKNKQKGKGRTAYERKRARVLASPSHLIVIDLLRGNTPMTMLGEMQSTDYLIVVSRSWQRPKADLYGFNLPEPVPSFPLPLKPEERELEVDLQTIIDGMCERAGYNERISVLLGQ